MNRKKCINDRFKAKAKKANAKLSTKKKAPYVSKADRAKLAAQATEDSEAAAPE